jgi:hypothetical protein
MKQREIINHTSCYDFAFIFRLISANIDLANFLDLNFHQKCLI